VGRESLGNHVAARCVLEFQFCDPVGHSRAHPSWGRLILPVSILNRMAACAVTAIFLSATLAHADQEKAPIRLAILPIVVHSADDPSYLRDGLADMLASRIEQAGGFEVVRVDDASMATTQRPRAIASGRAVEVEFVLFGSFTRFGSGASLDMQCVSTREDFEGESLREIFVHTGSIGEVIPDLDELVGKVGRFAVPGFDTGVDVASAPPPSPDSTAKTGLEERIQDLEKAVTELKAVVDAAKP
jgi:TolB-like protein